MNLRRTTKRAGMGFSDAEPLRRQGAGGCRYRQSMGPLALNGEKGSAVFSRRGRNGRVKRPR